MAAAVGQQEGRHAVKTQTPAIGGRTLRALALSSFMAAGVGTLVGCSGSSPTAPTPAPAPQPAPAPAFTVSVTPLTAPGNLIFFRMFGSPASPGSTQLTAQRSPAGSLSGGWSSTPTSGVVGLAQNGLSAADNPGPEGTFVVRSAPKFDSGITITGNTNTVSADCLDTTPPGTTSICTDNADVGLGQRPYNFTLTSTGSGTPPVVSVSGSFSDGAWGLATLFTISNAPTINAGGTFSPSGQVNLNYVRPGPPRLPIPITVREDWTITAATVDSFTGTATVLITPSGNRCGQSQNVACTGNVTIRRTILTAQRR
jgi:hypothetical protein